MKYTFTILGKMANLNDFLAAERVRLRLPNGKLDTKGNQLKKKTQNIIIPHIRERFKGIKVKEPIIIHYHFYEPNKKRDLDNIASFSMKVIQDSLVLSKVLTNDGWEQIRGFTCDFDVDHLKPRIEVTLEEVEV